MLDVRVMVPSLAPNDAARWRLFVAVRGGAVRSPRVGRGPVDAV